MKSRKACCPRIGYEELAVLRSDFLLLPLHHLSIQTDAFDLTDGSEAWSMPLADCSVEGASKPDALTVGADRIGLALKDKEGKLVWRLADVSAGAYEDYEITGVPQAVRNGVLYRMEEEEGAFGAIVRLSPEDGKEDRIVIEADGTERIKGLNNS